MLKRALIAVSIAVLALVLIDWASSFVIPCPSQKIIPATGDQKDQHQTTEKSCSTPGVIIQGLALIWAISDWKPEVWTALATIAIAAFTLVLAIATYVQAGLTRTVANATKESADALPAIERAYVFLRVARHSVQFRSRDTPYETSRAHSLFVYYNFINHGKTPAILHEIRMGIRRSPDRLADDAWAEEPRMAIPKRCIGCW
jgi:hypothetical protein